MGWVSHHPLNVDVADNQYRPSDRTIPHINPSPPITLFNGFIPNRNLLALPPHPVRSLVPYS